MFAKPKNKKFQYQPRFSGDTINEAKDINFVSKWKQEQTKNKSFKTALSVKMLLLLLILVVAGMYYLDSIVNK
ncbi:MAG: hypothetical protein MUF43_13055 [Flavobacterium sp.]|nr:hypothetical protein [Flavobacterium sp.]